MNSLAAVCAASKRLGSTSSAAIDSEVSNANMMVVRSSGTWTVITGWAKEITSRLTAARNTPAVRWRRHPGRFGATLSSSSRFENLTV